MKFVKPGAQPFAKSEKMSIFKDYWKIDNISVNLVRNLDVSCESSYIEVWIYLKDI